MEQSHRFVLSFRQSSKKWVKSVWLTVNVGKLHLLAFSPDCLGA